MARKESNEDYPQKTLRASRDDYVIHPHSQHTTSTTTVLSFMNI